MPIAPSSGGRQAARPRVADTGAARLQPLEDREAIRDLLAVQPGTGFEGPVEAFGVGIIKLAHVIPLSQCLTNGRPRTSKRLIADGFGFAATAPLFEGLPQTILAASSNQFFVGVHSRLDVLCGVIRHVELPGIVAPGSPIHVTDIGKVCLVVVACGSVGTVEVAHPAERLSLIFVTIHIQEGDTLVV